MRKFIIFGFAIFCLAMRASAFTASCSATVGTFVYSSAVTVGSTTTYFWPGLQIGPNEKAVLLTNRSEKADRFCKAFGLQTGKIGDVVLDGSGYGVVLAEDGSVSEMRKTCAEVSCGYAIRTLTCRN